MKHTAPTTTLESRTLWHNIVSTIIILAIATILAFSFFHITQSDPANIALIYILALIIIARITTGYFFGIISAFFCVIFINWCFTYPYFEVSFAISFPRLFTTKSLGAIFSSKAWFTSKTCTSICVPSRISRCRI